MDWQPGKFSGCAASADAGSGDDSLGILAAFRAYLRRRFELSRADDDGITELQHLQGAAKSGSARARAELEAIPRCPPDLLYVVEWYHAIRHRAQPAMQIGPLTWADIDAWEQRSGERLAPHELELFDIIDHELINSRRNVGGTGEG